MDARALGAMVGLALLAGVCSTGRAQTGQPAVENFRVSPGKLCFGDVIEYGFSYSNLPGGLAALTGVELLAHWPGLGDRPTSLWELVPDRDELTRHVADSGSFWSGSRYWRPWDDAPRGGAEVQFRVILTLLDGRQVTDTTRGWFEDSCPPPKPVATLAGGQTGRIGFETLTPTTAQFLTGVKDLSPVVIWGDFGLPREAAARLPAVVLMHGSEGVSRREARWAEELRATYVDDEDVSDRPIRIFHGTADDTTAIGPCRDYVARLRRAGKDVRLIEYPGARHAFDAPFLPPVLRRPKSVNTSRCLLTERPRGQLVNRETGQPFVGTDACVSRGTTMGYAPRAHAEAIQAVTEFLAQTFNLRR